MVHIDSMKMQFEDFYTSMQVTFSSRTADTFLRYLSSERAQRLTSCSVRKCEWHSIQLF